LRVAVLPELRLGTAKVTDVILLVIGDKNLNVQTGEHTYHQINAILGYPVLQAFERLTFTSNNHLFARPGLISGNSGRPCFWRV
jgi:hypothetical protein